METLSDEGCVAPTEGIAVLVCQLGAREHYLVARCFAKCGCLAALVTDFWGSGDSPNLISLRFMPKVVLSAVARYHPALEGQRITSFPALALIRYGLARFDKVGRFDAWISKQFAWRVRHLIINHSIFFGYSYDSLENLRNERKNGIFTVLCQTDPGPSHYRMIGEEETQFPEYLTDKRGWWTGNREERLREEWALADVIVVNSEWTRDAIVAEGADAGRIEILPLAYAMAGKEQESGERGQGAEAGNVEVDHEKEFQLSAFLISDLPRLRVLWLGNVALGKGIHYLIEAARLLVDEPIEFLVGGSLHIATKMTENGPKNIRWLGQIPRSRTNELYRDCDVFVFPTLSDGFGLTQLEAMANGLPVITTPNCGRVVENGRTGFVIPPRDSEALAEAILRFARNPQLAKQMAPACLEAVKSFSVDAYSQHLFEIIQRHMRFKHSADDGGKTVVVRSTDFP